MQYHRLFGLQRHRLPVNLDALSVNTLSTLGDYRSTGQNENILLGQVDLVSFQIDGLPRGIFGDVGQQLVGNTYDIWRTGGRARK